jgi:hypothetical protein
MMTPLLCLVLTTGLAATVPDQKVGPRGIPLFAEEKWYQDAAGEEQTFTGVLDINPGAGGIGLPRRFHSYRLSWIEGGNPVSRPVYMNGKDHLLALFVGHRVQLVAKLVDTEVEGKKAQELWPARLEVMGPAPAGVIGELEILARVANLAHDNPGLRRVEPQAYVIRNKDELTELLIGPRIRSDVVGQWSLRFLGGQKIDWNKQMLILVCGGMQHGQGMQVEISKVAVHEKWLNVTWKVVNRGGINPAGFIHYPLEAVLVPKFDGEVHVRREGKEKAQVIPAVQVRSGKQE